MGNPSKIARYGKTFSSGGFQQVWSIIEFDGIHPMI